jgi:putative intracellular protease/amidase
MNLVRNTLAFLLLILGLGAAEVPVIKVAVYEDKGATGKGIPCVTEIMSRTDDIKLTRLKGADIAAGGLRGYDLVMFTGGSGSAEAEGLGEKGREEVRDFVRNGGGYVGICAGAYLACSGFEWGVGILNAKTVSSKWRRGQGEVKVEGEAFGEKLTDRGVRYANGPIIKADVRKDLPAFETLVSFRTELAENDTPVGVMVNAPAMVRSSYGLGRVFTSSPHPEQTAGLEDLVVQAVRWTARTKGPTEELWRRLESMEVEKLWLPGAIVDWKTGLPTGQPIKDAKSKHTHCSQFVAAVADRLAIPLLRPPEHGVVLLANAQYDWLAADAGKRAGWVALKDGAAAQAAANDGRLVLASLKNPDATRPGHIAVVRPGTKDAGLLAQEGPDVMQAGGTNALRTSLRKGFGNHKKEYDQIAFYAHVVELTPAR